LLQFEIPMETIQFTIDFAYKHQIPVIVNPAPFQDIPEDILKKTAYFTPNEIELLAMTKTPLFASVEDKMVVTKGAEGVHFKTATVELRIIQAFSVDVDVITVAVEHFNYVITCVIVSEIYII